MSTSWYVTAYIFPSLVFVSSVEVYITLLVSHLVKNIIHASRRRISIYLGAYWENKRNTAISRSAPMLYKTIRSVWEPSTYFLWYFVNTYITITTTRVKSQTIQVDIICIPLPKNLALHPTLHVSYSCFLSHWL